MQEEKFHSIYGLFEDFETDRLSFRIDEVWAGIVTFRSGTSLIALGTDNVREPGVVHGQPLLAFPDPAEMFVLPVLRGEGDGGD